MNKQEMQYSVVKMLWLRNIFTWCYCKCTKLFENALPFELESMCNSIANLPIPEQVVNAGKKS